MPSCRADWWCHINTLRYATITALPDPRGYATATVGGGRLRVYVDPLRFNAATGLAVGDRVLLAGDAEGGLAVLAVLGRGVRP